MNVNMTKYFTYEELAELEKKGPKFLEDLKLQEKNRLYKDANFLFQRTQYKQMFKATEKYPEPLNPDSWTADELVDHAFQELVDQSHYLTALLLKVRQLESEVKENKKMAIYWRDKFYNLQGEVLR